MLILYPIWIIMSQTGATLFLVRMLDTLTSEARLCRRRQVSNRCQLWLKLRRCWKLVGSVGSWFLAIPMYVVIVSFIYSSLFLHKIQAFLRRIKLRFVWYWSILEILQSHSPAFYVDPRLIISQGVCHRMLPSPSLRKSLCEFTWICYRVVGSFQPISERSRPIQSDLYGQSLWI